MRSITQGSGDRSTRGRMDANYLDVDNDLFLSRGFLDQKLLEKDGVVDVWTSSDDLFFLSEPDPTDELQLTSELLFEDLLKFSPVTDQSNWSNVGESESPLQPATSIPSYELRLDDSCDQLFSTEASELVDSGSNDASKDTTEVLPTSQNVLSFQLGDLKVRTVKLVRSEPDGERSYPPLILTDEERRMLDKEGIVLPSHYPLTKQEERDLKRIRRKIRNKISAQDSRKRKRVYVDTLEEKVKECNEENQALKKRLVSVEAENSTLVAQLRHLKALLVKKTRNANSVRKDISSTAQPATCLLVLLLSFGLFMAPNMKNDLISKPLTTEKSPAVANVEKFLPFAGRSRSLLQQFVLEDLQLEADDKVWHVDVNASHTSAHEDVRWVELGHVLPQNDNRSFFDVILENVDVAETVKNGQNRASLLVEDF